MSSKVFSPISVTLSFHLSPLSPCLPFICALVVSSFISLELNWTNCLSVGTLLLLFIHIFTLFSPQLLSLFSHFTCAELFFLLPLSVPSSLTILTSSLLFPPHPVSVHLQYNLVWTHIQTSEWDGAAETPTRCHSFLMRDYG